MNDLNLMLDFMTQMLHNIAEFLSTSPMIYLFSFILMAIVFRIFSGLISRDRK